jgi:hypothetical protein
VGIETHELLTEEIPLEVSSALPEGSLVLRESKGALDPEVSSGRGWLWIALPGTTAGLLLAFFGMRAWRRRSALRIRISAYDVALRRLATLAQSGLPDAAAADAWYVELSAIVRRYLEDRYGVRAPELTTEEFLHEARRAPELSALHRDLLSSFLENCDRVKFAGYRPDTTESQHALQSARAFVEDTRLRAEPVTPAVIAATEAAT